ncbi:unnamed protein product, partial [Didymodactylos carnosus]
KREYFDSEIELEKKLDQLAQWISASKHFIVFTGAGVSTSTGIPDFRSGMDTVLTTGPGAWELRDNNSARPKNAKVLPDMNKAIPSPTHMALVELQRRGILKCVVSQNCDGLHLRSGLNPTGLAELHGNMNLEICSKCEAKYLRDYDTGIGRRDHLTGRRCDKKECDGLLKDSIIHFGENLPKSELSKAFEHADKADVCLALGSSLNVTPAADVPRKVAERKQKLIIGNLQRTALHGSSLLNIHTFTDTIMQGLMKRLNLPIPTWIVRRRIRFQIKNDSKNSYQVLIEGRDPDQDLPYSLFKSILVNIDNTELKSETSNSKFILKEEPFGFVADIEDEKSTTKIQLQINFFGHYNELPYNLEYVLQNIEDEFYLFYNPRTGVWLRKSRADDVTE